jgi:hypothetical protein
MKIEYKDPKIGYDKTNENYRGIYDKSKFTKLQPFDKTLQKSASVKQF